MTYNNFVDFLKENRIEFQFTQTLFLKTGKSVKVYFKNTETEYLIEDAFKWKTTEYGSEYWDKINSKSKTKLKGTN